MPHIHLVTPSFNKDISACVPDTVQGNEDVAVDEANRNPSSHGAYTLA